MVRTLVGTMIQTAAGERPPEAFGRLLEGAERQRRASTAPPQALCLVAVRLRGRSESSAESSYDNTN